MDLLASIEALKSLTRDHIVPTSKGGAHLFENLAIACIHCNWHMKRGWDPRSVAGADADRTLLIQKVREYLDSIRPVRMNKLELIRKIVGYVQIAS
jgi:hypothetical protein